MIILVNSSMGYVYLKAAFNTIYALHDHLDFFFILVLREKGRSTKGNRTI